jgi:hypothetical protein
MLGINHLLCLILLFEFCRVAHCDDAPPVHRYRAIGNVTNPAPCIVNRCPPRTSKSVFIVFLPLRNSPAILQSLAEKATALFVTASSTVAV